LTHGKRRFSRSAMIHLLASLGNRWSGHVPLRVSLLMPLVVVDTYVNATLRGQHNTRPCMYHIIMYHVMHPPPVPRV
jgi:hypothetical protein